MPDSSAGASGVIRTDMKSGEWNGVESEVSRFVCEQGPAWHSVTSGKPRLLVVLDEVGGRCELRTTPAKEIAAEFLGPKHLTFLPAGIEAFGYSSCVREVSEVRFSFNADRVAEFAPFLRFDSISEPRFMFSDKRARGVAQLIADEMLGSRQPEPLYIESLTLSLIVALAEYLNLRHSSRRRKLTRNEFSKAVEYVDAHLASPLMLKALAAAVGIAPLTFARAFTTTTGMAPHQWHMQMRVRRAQRAIIDHPELPLSKVAEQNGFADQGHLSRVFRQIVGTAPSIWKRERTSTRPARAFAK